VLAAKWCNTSLTHPPTQATYTETCFAAQTVMHYGYSMPELRNLQASIGDPTENLPFEHGSVFVFEKEEKHKLAAVCQLCHHLHDVHYVVRASTCYCAITMELSE
jgi:hypothetical protein